MAGGGILVDNGDGTFTPVGGEIDKDGIKRLLSVVQRAELGLSGVEKTHFMNCEQAAATLSGMAEIYSNANGAKLFIIMLDNEVALGADEKVLIGYSTTENDANVPLNIENGLNELTLSVARTGQAYYNLILLTEENPVAIVKSDGQNPFKTIAGLTDSATDTTYVLWTVE